MVSAGAAAHSDHGLDLVETLKDMANGLTDQYRIKDEEKIRNLAEALGLEGAAEAELKELTKLLADRCLEEWGRQEGEFSYLKQAPKETYEKWTRLRVKPRGINREAVEIMHRTHMGVDQDYENLLFQGVRCALADGWSSSMIVTDLQDALFGRPKPGKASLSLGTLSKTKINVVVHGQYSQLAEKILEAAAFPEFEELAKSKGAQGYQITGLCATANELQSRHGLPAAGDYLQQELLVVTGAVEVLVVDAQCAMEALRRLCDCYHTKLLTTIDKARFDSGENARHLAVIDSNVLDKAKEILKIAADNFSRRSEVNLPESESEIECGHSVESLAKAVGSNGSGLLTPLAAKIAQGAIKGVVGVLGCNNVRVTPGPSGNEAHVDLVKALIADDILVLTTGCSAMACGRAGLLSSEAISQAGQKLADFCRENALPPVLHMGSCIDNSRILKVMSELAKSGKIGTLESIPAAVAAPGWTTEQIVSTCFYFAASGINVVMGVPMPVQGVPHIDKYLSEDFGVKYGGAMIYEPDPLKAAALIGGDLSKKRSALGLA
jgi:carbon-monoxide dehydrogenase catalytic subunit